MCEVEIDPSTGALALVRYTAVNDHGVVINPLLLEGQVHGGIAQGLGQALLERTVYDPDSGQLVSGSFMDYAIPRADDLPMVDFHANCVPARTNPLGVKGVGESGCTAACPAVMNAIADALAPLGIAHLDMPATPERIWSACGRARAGDNDRRGEDGTGDRAAIDGGDREGGETGTGSGAVKVGATGDVGVGGEGREDDEAAASRTPTTG